jgi:hypothetical protein
MNDKPKNNPEIKHSELEATFQVPAIYSNRFIVNITLGGVRLSFLEESSAGVSRPVSAIFLSHQDFLNFKDLLVDMSKNITTSEGKNQEANTDAN